MGLKDWLFGKKCSRCKDSRTKNKSGICDICELMSESKKEVKILCPVCNVQMTKKILEEEIIIDKCPKCTGVFLGKGEIEQLRDIAENEAASSRTSGLVLGMAVSSALSRH